MEFETIPAHHHQSEVKDMTREEKVTIWLKENKRIMSAAKLSRRVAEVRNDKEITNNYFTNVKNWVESAGEENRRGHRITEEYARSIAEVLGWHYEWFASDKTSLPPVPASESPEWLDADERLILGLARRKGTRWTLDRLTGSDLTAVATILRPVTEENGEIEETGTSVGSGVVGSLHDGPNKAVTPKQVSKPRRTQTS